MKLKKAWRKKFFTLRVNRAYIVKYKHMRTLHTLFSANFHHLPGNK